MFRDRTNLYISFRQSYAHHPQYVSTSGIGGGGDSAFSDVGGGRKGGFIPEEQQGLISAGGDDDNAGDFNTMAIEMDVLPPAWIDISDEVDELLEQIEGKIGQLAGLHRKNALPGFDDRTHEEEQIERLTYEITTDLHKCQSLIKRFETLASRESNTNSEIKMSSNMKVSMATKVQGTSTKFRKMQSNYLRSLRNEAFAGSSNNNNDSNNNGSTQTDFLLLDDINNNSNSTMDADIDASFSTNTLEQQQHTQIHASSQEDEHMLLQREREITKIAQGILELSDIFKDLQTMIIDQGTLLDRIDYNIETMHTNVKQADKELIQATHYQKKTQKCKIILLLSLLVLGLFIILLVKPKHHNSTPPPPPPPIVQTTTSTAATAAATSIPTNIITTKNPSYY